MKSIEKIDALISEIEKMREALKQIEQMSDCGSYELSIVRMKQIATKALTNT